MTDLQTSLIAIGGFIVAGVITYNKFQEYKAKKSVERAFSSEHDDVLMQPQTAAAGSRHEPSFAGDNAGHSQQPADTAASMEHLAALAPEPKDLPIDDLIDCVLPMALEGPVRGDKVWSAIQPLRHIGSKPIHYIGLTTDDAWEPIAVGSAYTALHAGVQLVNRSSALNELEYSELVTRLRQIADELGAELEVPDMAEVMDATRALHQFLSEHDAQLGVNVHTNGAPWEITTLTKALERQGFDLRPDLRYVMQDGEGGALFSLSTNVTLAEDYTSRLTLLLDVPCVAPARNGFATMVACAKSLATRLDGTIVDDSNHALTDEALAEIEGQVHAFYDDMQAVNIAAGSPRALRLFS